MVAALLDLSRKCQRHRSLMRSIGHGAGPTSSRSRTLARSTSCVTQVAAVIAGNLHVSSVVLSNTLPNALPLRDDGSRAIFGKGYAGMSGEGYKWFVLGQVAQFRELLRERVSITAVGGISSGVDIRDYESVGATEFQVGAACYLGGEKVLHTIAAEYADLVC